MISLVGGFGHEPIWARNEKSLAWQGNEPNGSPLGFENCAVFQTVSENINGGGGLNDVDCRDPKSNSRLICRRPPINYDILDSAQPISASQSMYKLYFCIIVCTARRTYVSPLHLLIIKNTY